MLFVFLALFFGFVFWFHFLVFWFRFLVSFFKEQPRFMFMFFASVSDCGCWNQKQTGLFFFGGGRMGLPRLLLVRIGSPKCEVVLR